MFGASRDAAFEMIDAIASSPNARSAVEVSDSPLMQRRFASVYKGLERTRIDEDSVRRLLVQQAEAHGDLEVAGYRIQALDHTPYPRAHAPTVSDRGYVHGADGVVIGHQYSVLGRVMHASGAWVGVEDCERIATDQTPVQVGAEQVARLRQMSPSTCKHVITADSEYLTHEMLDQADGRTQLLIRMKNNRVLYHHPKPRKSGQRGRPAMHGRRVKLSDARTLGNPGQAFSLTTDEGGRIEIAVFTGLHVRSHPKLHGCVIRVRAFRADGRRKFARPIWLYWTGPYDMDWLTFWRVYLKRFCIESVHQFTKNALTWTSARLGYTDREERWTWLVMLAYWPTGNCSCLRLSPTMSIDLGRNPCHPVACPHRHAFNAITCAFSWLWAHLLCLPNPVVFHPHDPWAIDPLPEPVSTSFTRPPMSPDWPTSRSSVASISPSASRPSDALLPFV